MKGDEIVRPCGGQRNETVTLRKHVTKYKNTQKWILEKNRGIKIARVNSILITISIDLQLFTLILYGVGVRYDIDIFKLTASAQSIYREVYAPTIQYVHFRYLLLYYVECCTIKSRMYYVEYCNVRHDVHWFQLFSLRNSVLYFLYCDG